MSVYSQLRHCLLAAAGTLALTSMAGGQVVSKPMPAQTYSVYPTEGMNLPSRFAPGFDMEAERPNHPPIDQIPPMPMPEGSIFDHNPNGSVATTFHDIATGETFELPLNPNLTGAEFGQSPEGDFIGAYGVVENEPFVGRSFGTMSLAGSLDSWPRSGNVKLVMRFVDSGGTDRWFVCSGSMQDSGVVLCAAHCVYARNPNGINIFDWAEEIYIYPAWDGNGTVAGGPSSTEVIQNFGWARGDAFLAGSDYVNNGNWDRDCGAIRINRGSSRMVGMLTGWFGWAYGGSCTTQTYSNFSYPAEFCGGSLHNGRDMYYWSGSADSCPDNQLHLNTSPGCLTAVWGGMSGSGAYYISGDNRYVHAVCSTSNRSTSGNYCIQWEQWVNDLEVFKSGTRGSTFDLEALRCRATGSTVVQAGTAMDAGMQVLMSNATNANPGSTTYTIRVYLSTNNNISSGDTLLATWNYSYDFAAMQNVTFNIPAPVIPASATPGTYWIGVELDPSEDAFSSNNDTDTWDAQQVTVTLAAPAAPTYVSPSNGSTNNSINSDIDWNSAARATSYDVYFGTDSTPDGSEYLGNTASTIWFLPALSYNTQYYWQIVARNSAGTTAGPVWSFRTQVAPFVDLSPTAVFADRGTYYRGQNVAVDSRVTNLGTLGSSGYNMDVRASLNTIISTGDVLLSNTNYGALGAGSTRTITNQSVQLPPNMAPGNYYIGLIVNDAADAVSGNNTIADSATITVRACTADLAAPWGILDFFDLQAFLGYYSAQDPRADLTNDGVWDFFDLQTFLSSYSAGCP